MQKWLLRFFTCLPLCSGSFSQLPHVDDAPNAVTLLHGVEGLVDLTERLSMRDELVHLELARQIIIHEIRQLRAALDAAKGATLPDPTRHQLECCKKVSLDPRRWMKTHVEWKSLARLRPRR